MKTYFKFMLALFSAALLICGVCRFILKLRYMDVYTGFYTGGKPLVLIFNVVLALTPVIMFASNRLKKPDDDYPVEKSSLFMNLLAILTGLSILAFAIIGAPESELQQGYSEMFYMIRGGVNLVLGVLSGIAFVYLGAGGVSGRKSTPLGLVVVIPAIWQVVSMISRYNTYTTVSTISDHLLVVLFMVFNSLFLMGQARTVCSQMRKDGRNYAIPSGLCAALCGFLLVFPNYAYMADNRVEMPVALLGLFESVYILVMSLYALCFVISLIWSIKRV